MPAVAGIANWKRTYYAGDDACPDRACPMLLTPAPKDKPLLQELVRFWIEGGPGYPPEARCKGRFCMYEPECRKANNF
jgi:hypothetical protein